MPRRRTNLNVMFCFFDSVDSLTARNCLSARQKKKTVTQNDLEMKLIDSSYTSLAVHGNGIVYSRDSVCRFRVLL